MLSGSVVVEAYLTVPRALRYKAASSKWIVGYVAGCTRRGESAEYENQYPYYYEDTRKTKTIKAMSMMILTYVLRPRKNMLFAILHKTCIFCLLSHFKLVVRYRAKKGVVFHIFEKS